MTKIIRFMDYVYDHRHFIVGLLVGIIVGISLLCIMMALVGE